jgi:hypothetical protein
MWLVSVRTSPSVHGVGRPACFGRTTAMMDSVWATARERKKRGSFMGHS